MGVRAPKARKHLSADALFSTVRTQFATIAEAGRQEEAIPLADVLMAGFAMFSLKCPSLLDFDRQRAEGNLHTIYGLERVPCDTYLRERLDPVLPDSLRPVFTGVFRQLQRGKALEAMVFYQGCYLLALDGTGYFSSQTIHCASCLETQHRNGAITYSHQLLGAARIHPDRREGIPLMPEAILKQDGSEKNDCERTAAKRFLAKFRADHPHLPVIVTEDGLSSNAPHIETLQAYGCHYILGVKEGDHGYLFAQVHAAELAGRVQHSERRDRATGITHRFRFRNDVPLNASHPELRVHFLEYWEVHADHVQHFSWVTDLRVHYTKVELLMRGGRARWKIENETFKTLKNQGYHFDHNYGHGTQQLSVGLALLMMLAFLVAQAQQLCCGLFRAVAEKWGSKRGLWERLRALFFAYALTSMRQLLEALWYGFTKAAPQVALDSS
jgi:hypothetical protein